MRPLCLILVMALVVACGTSRPDEATLNSYRSRWDQRLDGYRGQFLLANAELRRTVERSARAMTASATPEWSRYSEAIIRISAGVREAFDIAGRQQLLERFVDRMASGPPSASARRWLAGEARELHKRSAHVQAMTEDFLKRLQKRIEMSPEWLREVQALAAEQGMVQGTARELQALSEATTAYYADLEKADVSTLYEDADDRATAAAVLGLSALLDGEVLYQRLEQELARPRACRVSGRIVACS